MTENILASAVKLWNEAAPGFDPSNATPSETELDPCVNKSNSESLKKLGQWMDHAVTKLAACAAVADDKDVQGLEPIAAEVVKCFVAITGTFMSLRRGAGTCFCSELQKYAQELASNLETLGASIGKPSMALAAGKVLDCASRLEHVSIHNRQAIEKRLQAILSQVRDGHRELKDALQQDKKEDGELFDEDDVFDDFLEPDEVAVAEATSATITLIEEILEEGIKGCRVEVSHTASMSVQDLEIIIKGAVKGQEAIDGLIAHTLGGLDQEEFAQSLQQLQEVVVGWGQSSLDVRRIENAFKDVELALANSNSEQE